MFNSDIFTNTEFKSPKLPTMPINLDNKHCVLEFLNRFDYILSDCDGVLWLNQNAVPGAPSAINKLRSMGKKIVFATNNSVKTREEFKNKLNKLGFHCRLDELFPTSYSSAVYLNSIGFDKKVYVVGCSGINGELQKLGIERAWVMSRLPAIGHQEWLM